MSKYPHIGILTTARDFLDAANRLNDGPQCTAAPMPVYYLYFHCIELCLKSYLCFRSMSDKEMRNDLRHDLDSCWTCSVKQGISDLVPDSQELVECIKIMNPLYRGKELEYYVHGLKRVPEISHVFRSANMLHSELDKFYRLK